MDLASLLGLLLGIAFLVYGMLDGGGSLSSFWSLSSIAVTMGGGIASTIIGFTMDDLK